VISTSDLLYLVRYPPSNGLSLPRLAISAADAVHRRPAGESCESHHAAAKRCGSGAQRAQR
jgi:hypothetical protein